MVAATAVLMPTVIHSAALLPLAPLQPFYLLLDILYAVLAALAPARLQVLALVLPDLRAKAAAAASYQLTGSGFGGPPGSGRQPLLWRGQLAPLVATR